MPTPQQITHQTLCLILRSVCQRTKEPEVVMHPDKLICKVHPEDQGRCVGKKGLNFWAMSTIMWWLTTAQLACPMTMRLLEPVSTPKRPQPPFRPPTTWDQIDLTSLGQLLEEVLLASFKEKRPWVIEKGSEVGKVTLLIKLNKYLQTSISEPNYAEALSVYFHTVGMVRGLDVKTEVSWG